MAGRASRPFGARFDDPLLDRLVMLGEAQDHAIRFGEYDAFERLNVELTALKAQGESRDDFAAKLALLYDHGNPQVRWIAGVWSYADAPKAARDALKRLAGSEFNPQCIYASFAVDDIDSGGRAPTLERSCRPPFDEIDLEIELIHAELMEPADLLSLDVAALVARIVEIGLAQEYAMENDESGKYNALYERATEIGNELARRGRDACLALTHLFTHQNGYVRINAARYSFEVAPEAARTCLEAIANSRIPIQHWIASSLVDWMDKHPKRQS